MIFVVQETTTKEFEVVAESGQEAIAIGGGKLLRTQTTASILSSFDKPDLSEKAKNAAGALIRAGSALIQGKKIRVTREESERRLDICRVCKFYHDGRCAKCGCLMNLKARLETEHCPINKW